MKAVVFDVHGGPEVLHSADVEKPVLGFGEAVVQVKACALNRLDLWLRKGIPGVKIPMPHILGSDISGVVAETGLGVEGWSREDEVVVAPGFGDGTCEECLAGRENYCVNYQIIGYRTKGGYAEFVRVPAANLMRKPSKLSFVEAASIPLVFLTAWQMMVDKARIRMGETILVVGAGSGVGVAAIQIAKLFNCTVVTTVSSEEKAVKAKALGADFVINRGVEDVQEVVKRVTSGRGVDLVVEHAGAAIWDTAVRSLGRGGRLVTCGATTGPQVSVDLRFLFSKQQSIMGSYMGTKGDLVDVLRLVDRGALRPVVDSVFPLERAVDAHRRLEAGESFGKVVLTLD
ncbi:MAG: zinc-binding dehydrogenase [Thaumarchaeota archaeon]|nr:zinc-binding dehydrogenase [Nitrososphaerota archaeon]